MMPRKELNGIWPIPLAARRGLLHPAFAWSGFSSAFASIVIGNLLQGGLGTVDALLASVIGSWLLFIYSASIGFAAGRWGLNFQLMLAAVFGKVGALIPGLLLAALVAGWFGFHVALTLTVLWQGFGFANDISVMDFFILGGLFALPVMSGISHSFNLTAIALPAMILFAIIVVVQMILPNQETLLDGPLKGTLSFGTGVTIVFGMFVVSGTMTGDIVRYCRTGNEAIQVMAVGFIFSNLPFLVLGVLVSAVGLDVVQLLGGHGVISLLLAALIIISQLTISDACLANATVTLKSAFPRVPWAVLSAMAALFGIMVGICGIIHWVFSWATFLTAVAPPVGGIIVADYYIVRAHIGFSRARDVQCNLAALLALLVAIAISILIWLYFLDLFTPLIGAPLAAVLYLALAAIAPQGLGAGLGKQSLGAEAID